MTTLELTDLIQQQLNENPVLEEVATQEEARELAEKILDHMASGGELENLPGARTSKRLRRRWDRRLRMAPATAKSSVFRIGDRRSTTVTSKWMRKQPRSKARKTAAVEGDARCL